MPLVRRLRVQRRYDELWTEATAFDLAEAEAQAESSAGRRRSPSLARQKPP